MVAKNELLHQIRQRVEIVDERYRQPGVPQDQRITAVLAMFVAECNGGRASVMEVAEAWDELNAIGKVVREDYSLKPTDKNCWQVDLLLPVNEVDEEESGPCAA